MPVLDCGLDSTGRPLANSAVSFLPKLVQLLVWRAFKCSSKSGAVGWFASLCGNFDSELLARCRRLVLSQMDWKVRESGRNDP